MKKDPDAVHHAAGFPAFAKACRQVYARLPHRPPASDDRQWRRFYDDRSTPEQAVAAIVAEQDRARDRRGE